MIPPTYMFIIFRHISIKDVSTSTRVSADLGKAELTINIEVEQSSMLKYQETSVCSSQLIGIFFYLYLQISKGP